MLYVTVDLPLFPVHHLQPPFLFLLMFSVTLQTTLRNFSHINLVFPMPWGMKSVSSKVFFLTSGFQILVAFDYSKINTWGAKRSLGGKGADSSPFSFFQEKRTGLSSCLHTELYFREDWTNFCPETAFLREPTASVASLFGIFQTGLHILRGENFFLMCPFGLDL